MLRAALVASRRLLLLLAALLFVLSAVPLLRRRCCTPAKVRRGLPPGWSEHYVHSAANEERHFAVYVPKTLRPATDVLLFFHGFDGTGREDCSAVKAHEKAEAFGFVAVCPDALGSPLQLARACSHSPECRPLGRDIVAGSAAQDWSLNNTTGRYWRAYPHGGYSLWWNRHVLGTDDGPQDVQWAVDELLPWVWARLPLATDAESVEPRVFLSGLSLGAAMAFRLACERSEAFAGLLVANEAFLDPATGWGQEASGHLPTCRLPKTFRSWQAQSDDDFWYGLGQGRMSYELGWEDFAKRAMGCQGPAVEVFRSPSGNRTCEEYPGCTARLCRYHHLGHDPTFILLEDSELKGWEAGWKYVTARASEYRRAEAMPRLRR